MHLYYCHRCEKLVKTKVRIRLFTGTNYQGTVVTLPWAKIRRCRRCNSFVYDIKFDQQNMDWARRLAEKEIRKKT